jgi:hypothetical protein
VQQVAEAAPIRVDVIVGPLLNKRSVIGSGENSVATLRKNLGPPDFRAGPI